jgi:hypothetical protein
MSEAMPLSVLRFELAKQRLQPRLGQMFLQLQGVDGALMIFSIVIKRVADRDNHSIDEQIERVCFHQ